MWLYNSEQIQDLSQVPESATGFVYLIENLETKEFYIGRKALYSTRTLPPLKDKKRKRKVTKESDWLNYQSSNDVVKTWTNPKKTILRFTYSKKELTYQEVRALFKFDALEDSKCLNANILAKFFKGEFSSAGK